MMITTCLILWIGFGSIVTTGDEEPTFRLSPPNTVLMCSDPACVKR